MAGHPRQRAVSVVSVEVSVVLAEPAKESPWMEVIANFSLGLGFPYM